MLREARRMVRRMKREVKAQIKAENKQEGGKSEFKEVKTLQRCDEYKQALPEVNNSDLHLLSKPSIPFSHS